jgi:amino acid transporter
VSDVNKKKFGFWSMVLLGVNSVIGSGIFLLPGKAMAIVGPGSIFVYIFMAVITMAIALCYCECSSKFNRYGAAYVYAREVFGEYPGFLVGIMAWTTGITGWAVMAVAFATALSAVWPPALQEPYRTIIIISIQVGLGILNLLGVRIMKYVSNLVTVGKLVPLVLFVLFGVFFINGSNFEPMFPHGVELDSIGAASLIIFYAFTGFAAMAGSAPDMENPQKNIPISIIVVMGFVSVVYFMVQAVCVGVLGPELAKSSAPVAQAAGVLFGPYGMWLVTIGSLVSIGGINVSTSFVAPRAGVALAQDGLLPRKVGEMSRFGTPYLSIIITVMLSIPVALSGSFVYLVAITMISRFAQYMSTCLAVMVLRRKRPDLVGTFSIPFGPLIPIFAICITLWMVTKTTSTQLIWGLGAIGIGTIVYLFMKYWDKHSINESSAQ